MSHYGILYKNPGVVQYYGSLIIDIDELFELTHKNTGFSAMRLKVFIYKD